MEKKENENFFDFLPENSIIKYKKFKFNYKSIEASNFSLKKSSYQYDIYTQQFIYFINDSIYIFNTKGAVEGTIKYIKYTKFEKISYCNCDQYNKLILIVTEKNKVILIDLKKQHSKEYNTIDMNSGAILGIISGGFFIPKIGKNKDDKKKEGDEYNIGLISNNSYRIVNILLSEGKFQFKNIFVSNKIPITEYYFNNIFNVLIIRNEYQGFFLINLKNSYCYSSCIELNISNVYFTSKFYIQNIYNKLYFIHFTENLIEFYRLNNLKEKKEPKKIRFNKSDKSIDYEFTQIQFYNNLMILYMGDNIRLYDIKAGQKKKFGKIEIPSNKNDGFFDKIKIAGKFVIINNDIYKIKFLPEVYLKINVTNTYETFFSLLRRKHSTEQVISLLINLIEQYELSTFYAILFKILENYDKSLKKIKYDDKKNIHEIIYIGHNYFYLPQDNIFSIFNNDFNNIEKLKLLQIIITVCNEYKKRNIPIDKEVFMPVIIHQLGKTDDFSFLDSMINNEVIPFNKTLGLLLIDTSKSINDKEKKKLSLNLGIEILLSEKENIDYALQGLIEEEKYKESINIITDFYFGYSYKNDKKKDIKDINKNLRKFITEKLTHINKMRGQSSIIDEDNIDI